MDIPRFSASVSRDNLGAALRETGVVIVDGVLGPETLGALNAEADAYFARGEDPQLYMNGAVTTFFAGARNMPGLAGRSDTFLNEVLANPVFMTACDAILKPSCASYQLNFANIMERGPGAPRQMFHRDGDVWVHMPKPGPELEIATMTALGPFTAAMGATLIAPGSHRWERGRVPRENELVIAELEPGDSVIYLGSVIHAGGANATDDVKRRGLHVSYCLGWLRTQDNHCLAPTLEKIRHCPAAIQRLLGYGAHDAVSAGGGFLGAVDWRDPVELIAEGRL